MGTLAGPNTNAYILLSRIRTEVILFLNRALLHKADLDFYLSLRLARVFELKKASWLGLDIVAMVTKRHG